MIVCLSKFDLLSQWITPFLSGAFVVVLAEIVRHRLFKPNLRIVFKEISAAYIARTKETYEAGKTREAYYVRVKVTNKSRILARKCRAYLINIEKRDNGRKFDPTVYRDSIQLAWSCQPPDYRYKGIDIPKGVNQFLDVVVTRQGLNEFDPQIIVKPYRYLDLFRETGEFRLTIQVYAAGADPATLKLIFRWEGQWDKFTVTKEN
jgi:hypothetical protein